MKMKMIMIFIVVVEQHCKKNPVKKWNIPAASLPKKGKTCKIGSLFIGLFTTFKKCETWTFCQIKQKIS